MSFGFGLGFPKRLTSGGGLSPRLYLDFVGTGSLPSTVTFSRGTNATLTDSNGRVAWAPHNLLTNSEDFEAAAWTKFRSSVTANATVAPDGTTTAEKLVPNAGLTQGGLYNTTGVTTAVGTTYTASVYVKAAELGFAFVAANVTASYVAAVCVNLSTGAQSNAGANGTYAVTNVGNGWWRVTCTAAATAATGFLEVFPLAAAGTQASYTGDGTSGIYVWGAQLNVANAPVNLLTWSEQFNNAAWTKGNATITADATTAPDGTLSADKVVEATGTVAPNVNVSVSVTSGVAYTLSVYAKVAGRSSFQFYWTGGNPTNNPYVNFDLSSGTATVGSTGATATISAVGNGWYRCTATYTASITASQTTVILVTNSPSAARAASYTGDGTSGIFLWGAQLNTGSVALPYVATTSSIYLPPAYNSTTPKNLLGFTQEPENAAWTKSNSYVQQNLLTWSQDFDNAAWTPTALNTTGTPAWVNVTTAPDGTNTADKLIATAVNSSHSISQTVGTGLFVFSFYAKAAEYSAVSIANNPDNYIHYNLATGQVSSAGTGWSSGSMTSVGNGWWRCVGINAASKNWVFARIYANNAWQSDGNNATGLTFTGDGTSGVFVWGAQLVQGSTAGDYTQTTSAAAPTRYLNWDGTLTGRKLVETTAAGLHIAEQNRGVGTEISGTFSIYAKAGERTKCRIQSQDSTYSLDVDLSNGSFIAKGANIDGYTITPAGNNWWRIAALETSGAAWRYCSVSLLDATGTASYTGDGTSGIYVSDFQLSNSASVDPYVYNPQAAAASAAYYGPRFDYNPTGTPVLGSELVTSPYSGSVSGGFSITATSVVRDGITAGGSASLTLSTATTIGAFYQITFTASGLSGDNTIIRVGTTSGGTYYQITAAGTYTVQLPAGGAAAILGIAPFAGTAGAITITNISVKAVTGYTATANGLLIEEQRTNLLTYSEQFDNGVWAKTSSTVTANTAVAPDGTTTADTITTAAAGSYISQDLTINGAFVFSVYLKRLDNDWVVVENFNSTDKAVWFNLNTGVVGTQSGATGTIQSVGNGWYRCSCVHTASSAATSKLAIFAVAGDGSSVRQNSVYAWGAQLEAGSFATSYIPTVASQVTRNADSASMLGDNFYTWYNPNQGSFTFRGSPREDGSVSFYTTLLSASSGNTIANQIGFGASSSGSTLYGLAGSSSVIIGSLSSTPTAMKLAMGYAPNSLAGSKDGGAAVTTGTVTLPGGVDRLFIGGAVGAAGSPASINGVVQSIGYYNTRLSDSTLQALTT